jgi:predicted RNase H-like HicB family nuclease
LGEWEKEVLLRKKKKKEYNMEYTAIIEKTDDGWYIAHCAEVPNAHTQGSTIEEVEENLKDAIELILDCEREISMQSIRTNTSFYRKIAVL